MTSKVLVLGAQGYVGRRVVAALAASDWAQPVAAGRRAGAGVDIVVDATDSEALAQAFAQADAVVNCMAGSPAAIVENAKALRLALQRVPARLVHFSSMAIYGAIEGLIDESCPPAGGVGGYSAAKAQAEQELAQTADKVVLRPGCIYGPGSPQWTDRIAALVRARRIGDLGERGDGCSNLVHVDDVVQAVLAALRLPGKVNAVYNLAMRDAPDWNDYFLAMARELGAVPVTRIGNRRLKIETHLAAPALKILEILARRAKLRMALPPPIPPSLARLWGQDIRLDSRAAERDLGLLPWRSLQEGVRDSLPRPAGARS
ncbi:Nucleoside-diphosphate-sugar epimerases [plant metagenome]|uniref:Nucleoside-diphosphate-sugar epimerases n=1 Tax=plant metagenome TaxID=1297885 RepID=A0A484RJC2_9ZZZZ